MAFRFVDIDHPPSEYEDFAVREMRPTLVQMVGFCIALCLIGSAGVYLTGDRLLVIPLLFIIVGLASSVAGVQVHRNREARRATELLNALFASALGRGWWFCLIARKDGRIVYASPGFHALFDAKKDGYGLAEWIAAAGVSEEAETKILALAQGLIRPGGQGVELPLSVMSKDGWHHTLLLAAEPIDRPKGFILLRARSNPQGAV